MYSVPSNLHSKNNTVCIGINCYYYYHYHSEGVKKISYTIYIILTPQNKFEIRLIIFRKQGGGTFLAKNSTKIIVFDFNPSLTNLRSGIILNMGTYLFFEFCSGYP